MKKKIIYAIAFLLLSLFINAVEVNAAIVVTEDIPSRTYIIGTHMFTREGSSSYDGTLTTKYIMLASKTITGEAIDDMVIYYKNARGVWVDVLTNTEVEMPNTVEVEYKDNERALPRPTLNVFNRHIIESTGASNDEMEFDISLDFDDTIGLDSSSLRAEICEVEFDASDNYTYLSCTPVDPYGSITKRTVLGFDRSYIGRLYSEYEQGRDSISKTVVAEIPVPEYRIGLKTLSDDETKYDYDMSFPFMEEYATGDINSGDYTIDGIEIYTYDGDSNNYTFYKNGTIAGSTTISVPVDQRVKFAVRAYINSELHPGEKLYSEYSNLSLVGDLKENYLDISFLNNASFELYEECDETHCTRKTIQFIANNDGTYYMKAVSANGVSDNSILDGNEQFTYNNKTYYVGSGQGGTNLEVLMVDVRQHIYVQGLNTEYIIGYEYNNGNLTIKSVSENFAGGIESGDVYTQINAVTEMKADISFLNNATFKLYEECDETHCSERTITFGAWRDGTYVVKPRSVNGTTNRELLEGMNPPYFIHNGKAYYIGSGSGGGYSEVTYVDVAHKKIHVLFPGNDDIIGYEYNDKKLTVTSVYGTIAGVVKTGNVYTLTDVAEVNTAAK